MSQVQIVPGLRVQVDISGLQAKTESDGVTMEVRIGSGPGMTATGTGTVLQIDQLRGLVIVRLDMPIAGRTDYPFPPSRILAAI